MPNPPYLTKGMAHHAITRIGGALHCRQKRCGLLSPSGSGRKLTDRCRSTSAPALSKAQPLFLGLDFGTSGARASVVTEDGEQVAAVRCSYSTASNKQDGSAEDSATWHRVLFHLLEQLPQQLRVQLAGIAVDGTSATTLLVDKSTGHVLTGPLMYNTDVTLAAPLHGQQAVEAAQSLAPAGHMVTSRTSALCKLLTWHYQGLWQQATAAGAEPVLCHQADWIAGLLCRRFDGSSYNNCLKLGYDVFRLQYPDWLTGEAWSALLPRHVGAPGSPLAPVTEDVAVSLSIPLSCWVYNGTTDSIAAFLASGARDPGSAVTSLGSTLALKLVSTEPVEDAATGVYCHRLGDTWLVGGASNSGCAILRKHFTDEQLAALSSEMNPVQGSGLDYYPLLAPGERFPVNNPDLQPRVEPRPQEDVLFLQGLLEGIARIEAQGYEALRRLGGSPLRQVYTAGGGAKNPTWTTMRAALLGVPVAALQPPQDEASYGAALLARDGWQQQQQTRTTAASAETPSATAAVAGTG